MTAPDHQDVVTLRLATPEDAREVVRVHREAVLAVSEHYYSAAQLQHWAPKLSDERIAQAARDIGKRDDVFFVATRDSVIVGFGSVFADGLVQCIYVHPDHGNQGVGTVLMDRLEQTARDLGASSLRLEASRNAEAFYHRRGFVVDKQTTKQLHDMTFSILHMSKPLR